MSKGLTTNEKRVNAYWLVGVMKMLKENGVWVWQAKNHEYRHAAGKLYPENSIAEKDLRRILPADFAKKVIAKK